MNYGQGIDQSDCRITPSYNLPTIIQIPNTAQVLMHTRKEHIQTNHAQTSAECINNTKKIGKSSSVV